MVRRNLASGGICHIKMLLYVIARCRNMKKIVILILLWYSGNSLTRRKWPTGIDSIDLRQCFFKPFSGVKMTRGSRYPWRKVVICALLQYKEVDNKSLDSFFVYLQHACRGCVNSFFDCDS